MNIIVIGSGAVALQSAVYLQAKYMGVRFVENRITISSSEKQCVKKGISYVKLSGENLTSYLIGIEEETLIVSVANRYIFPSEVVKKPNLTIINYHGALLPKYPGRNAEAWAIYNEEKYAGITWHFVNEDVDAGSIIIQKKTEITNTTKSIDLLRVYGKLAIESLQEITQDVVNKTIKTSPNNQTADRTVYYSWMKPNEGYINPDWSSRKMSAFLRAMDYGPIQTMGLPKIRIDEEDFEIVKYSVFGKYFHQEGFFFDKNNLTYYIKKSDGEVQLKLKQCES